jgi:mannan endo-1,4-beta-mannosidase
VPTAPMSIQATNCAATSPYRHRMASVTEPTAEPEKSGVTEPTAEPGEQWGGHRRAARAGRRFSPMTYIAVVVVGAAVLIGAVFAAARFRPSGDPAPPAQFPQSSQPIRYLGVFEPDAPGSYSGIDQFAQAIGRQPNIVSYYSYWLEPFQSSFATAAAKHGAMTLVQIDAKNIPLASIADGQYDPYLRSYAAAVKAFGSQVILSFGHEMNGNWYSWGYQHTPAAVFVAAWRHIVTVFRDTGTKNVTWLWTVNIVDALDNHIPGPASWWPGSSYVNWVGIDGYYYSPSWKFAPLFGPTIAQVRALTRDPILIAETGAARSADQPAKIADLFSGVRAFGLLGLVWFDQNGVNAIQDWRLNTPAAIAALRQAAKAYMKPVS